MKCIHCGSEWNVSPGLSVSITNCPFCGKSLVPEKKTLETVEDVLVEINRRFGVNVLTDNTKLVAYFSDIAPQLSRQRRILSYFVECNGPKKLAAVMNASENERLICAKQLIKEMKDIMFIDEDASRMICDAFLFSVSGHHLSESSVRSVSTKTVEKQPIVSPPKQEHAPKTSTLIPAHDTNSNSDYSNANHKQPRTANGPIRLRDALRKLESTPNPSGSTKALIEQYRTILKSEGKYIQLHTHPYGPFYFTVDYDVQNNMVLATIDYSGFAGTFPDPGKVSCKTGFDSSVVIEAEGVNEYTFKSHKFVFQITGNTVDITGTGGFGHQTCMRDK